LEQAGILHFATHGIAYASDPLNSFLVLTASPTGEAMLAARRILSLSTPADLVTLSACQTGLGFISGDGVLGLAGAFLSSGARAVLVSGWSVSDRATALLMQGFYKAYVTLDNKALALQQAMRTLREQPGFDHPCYWAAFAIIGAEA
jgi:CHAT domain-containing protein